jgi:hypothetical protein
LNTLVVEALVFCHPINALALLDEFATQVYWESRLLQLVVRGCHDCLRGAKVLNQAVNSLWPEAINGN